MYVCVVPEVGGILSNSFALCKTIAYSKTFVEYEVMEMNGFIQSKNIY